MITDETSGVWDLWDAYAKTNADRWATLGNFLFAWGENQYGSLGQNNITRYSSPVQIPGASWRSVSGGRFHTLATKDDGTLWAWGVNSVGSLGQNNRTFYSSPIQIPGTTWRSVISASKNSDSSFAIKTDGTLWAWGQNGRGQIGQNNDNVQYSSPVQIPGTTWSSISCGYSALATKTDGTLWAWGYNSNGELGHNNTTYYSSPRQIPGNTWKSVDTSTRFGLTSGTLATKTDGTLWAWGGNNYGLLGLNNRTKYSSPVQIPGTTWNSISIGEYHSLAIKTDGTLWAWGSNSGNLGQNNRTQYSSPVQIPGNTWSSIRTGRLKSLATKTDGTLWSWGSNFYGQLGQNNRTYRSSPVQIPGTQWNSISLGYESSFALQNEF